MKASYFNYLSKKFLTLCEFNYIDPDYYMFFDEINGAIEFAHKFNLISNYSYWLLCNAISNQYELLEKRCY